MGNYYEEIECECGHTCPVGFAVMDSEGVWTCPNCVIDMLTSSVESIIPTKDDIIGHIEFNTRNAHGEAVMDEQAFYEGAMWLRSVILPDIAKDFDVTE